MEKHFLLDFVKKKKKCVQRRTIPPLKRHLRISVVIAGGLMVFFGVLTNEIPCKIFDSLSICICMYVSRFDLGSLGLKILKDLFFNKVRI